MTLFGTLGQFIAALLSVLTMGVGPVSLPEMAPPPHRTDSQRVSTSDTSSAFADFSALVAAGLRGNVAYQQAAVVGADEPETPQATIEDALVNVHCTARTPERHYSTSGSGVLISSQGVILTNAHVAHFLLLPESTASSTARCTVRTGSPATDRYRAELLYLSPTWITENATQLYAEHQVGTGERDFALLRITDAIEGALPPQFPALVFAPRTYTFRTERATHVAGYLPEASGELAASFATTSTQALFTFSDEVVDLLALAPSAVGAHGASGGPVTDEDGILIGLITTRGDREIEGQRSLRALTVPYIDRTLEAETGLTLSATLAGNLPLRGRVFLETLVPPLRAYLKTEARPRAEADS